MKEKKNSLLISLSKNALLNDRGLLFSFLSILTGLIFGSVLTVFPDNGIKDEILSLFVSFNTEITDKSKIEIFSGIILSGLVYFGIMFFLGGNVFGKELSLIVTAIKASGITAVIAFLYSHYALKGLEYCLLVFLPGKIIFIFAMLFITKSCFDFSKKLRHGASESADIKAVTKLYSLKAVFSLLIFMLSWIIDFLTLIIFTGLFDFRQ